MDELIRTMLERLAGIMQKTISDSVSIIIKTPGQFLGDSGWNTLLHIGRITIIPFSAMIVAFCMAFELYNVYCKANGEIDAQLVTTTVMKFVVPFLFIASSYELMEIIFSLFGTLTSKMWTALNPTIPSTSIDLDAFMNSISGLSWWSKLGEVLLILVAVLGMYILAGVVYVVIYLRIFEITIYWIIAPIPLATLMHSEYNQIGKNFLKLFAAVLLQGVLLILCLSMYSAVVVSKVFEASQWGVYSLLLFSAVLVFFIIKTGSISRRLLNTF